MNALPQYIRPVAVDLAVYAPDLTLVMAVKCMMATDPQDAAGTRSMHIEHEYLRAGTPLLMVGSKGFFFWKQGAAQDQLPDFSASPSPPVEPGHVGRVSSSIIWSWLWELATGYRKPDPDSEADQLLVKAGLYDKLLFGDIREMDNDR